MLSSFERRHWVSKDGEIHASTISKHCELEVSRFRLITSPEHQQNPKVYEGREATMLEVYLAGVGSSPSQKGSNSSSVSAATKALLDAGITLNDVSRGLGSKSTSEAFEVLGGSKVDEVEQGSELDKAVSLVKDRKARCVLVIAEDQVSLP